MSHDTNGGVCEACARACEDCKTKSTQLEKKNFRLAIVLTSALTLLGEQGVKAVAGIISSMGEVVDAGGDPPAGATSSASGDDGYQFGPKRYPQPAFTGWRPPWETEVDGRGVDGDQVWLPPDRLSVASIVLADRQEFAKGSLSRAVEWSGGLEEPGEEVAHGLMAIAMDVRDDDYMVAGDPAPVVGYSPSETGGGWGFAGAVPPPESLYVFALGGMVRLRGR